MSTEPMRVLIAARLSKKKDKQAGHGIETQDERAREWAELGGHTVVGVAADTASGIVAPWNRKNLKPWVTDPVRMASYDAIVAYKMDRLSRAGWRDESDIRRWAEDNGKKLIIVDGPQWPPRDDGDRWAWEAMAIKARKEWESIQERVVRSQTAIRANGALHGKAGYGHAIVGNRYHKTLEINETEARVIRQAKERYLGGETIDAIVRTSTCVGSPSAAIAGMPRPWLVSCAPQASQVGVQPRTARPTRSPPSSRGMSTSGL